MNTLSSLNDQIWYRLLKSVYLVSLVLLALLGSAIVWTVNSGTSVGLLVVYVVLWLIALGVIYEAIRRIFYYVVLGTINPQK